MIHLKKFLVLPITDPRDKKLSKSGLWGLGGPGRNRPGPGMPGSTCRIGRR
jgi:hypothetical protein